MTPTLAMPCGGECSDGLVHQAEERHHEQHSLALGQRTVGNCGGEHRLAGAGRGLNDRPAVSGDQCTPKLFQGEVLVRMKVGLHCPSSTPGCPVTTISVGALPALEPSPDRSSSPWLGLST